MGWGKVWSKKSRTKSTLGYLTSSVNRERSRSDKTLCKEYVPANHLPSPRNPTSKEPIQGSNYGAIPELSGYLKLAARLLQSSSLRNKLSKAQRLGDFSGCSGRDWALGAGQDL